MEQKINADKIERYLMSRWDNVAGMVVIFAEWWDEYKRKYNTKLQEKDAIAMSAFRAGFEAGRDAGFEEGQYNMLEAGYELPHNPQED